MPELLVEFYSEEIPARMQLAAAEQLAQRATALFKEQGLAFSALKTYVTPQRLVLYVSDLPLELPARSEEIRGPKTDAPAQALQGFLGRYGLSDASGLQKTVVGKAEYYVLQQQIEAQPIEPLLPELIYTIRQQFSWPKAMRHGESDNTWVRPLHHIFILFDGQVLSTAREIFGHRFLSIGSFTPKDFADYQAQLLQRHVLLDHVARRAKIVADADSLAAKHGYMVATHGGMLDEVTGLVEYPFLKMGTFDAAYLQLPPELLMAVMHSHQKYLPLRQANGEMAPAFLFAANIPGVPDDAAIINGNERVLRARLSDARFFFQQDLVTRLESWLPKLEQITFHQKLGTVADKVARLQEWVQRLLPLLPNTSAVQAVRAAQLSKADLVSGMVGEFPELQGIMGRNYALVHGEEPDVAAAIAEHYQPMGPNAPVPDKPVSIILALADKLDSLSAFFGIDEKPTGSKDPFALRRAALGIIRLILHNQLALPLVGLVSVDLLAFIQERFRVLLRDEGLPHDVIDATPASDDLLKFANQTRALNQFLQSTAGQAVRTAVKRALNILKAEEQKDKTVYQILPVGAVLPLPAEQALQTAITELPAMGPYDGLVKLTAPLDQFFADVLVNDADAHIRLQRLQLLSGLRSQLIAYADFSALQG